MITFGTFGTILVDCFFVLYLLCEWNGWDQICEFPWKLATWWLSQGCRITWIVVIKCNTNSESIRAHKHSHLSLTDAGNATKVKTQVRFGWKFAAKYVQEASVNHSLQNVCSIFSCFVTGRSKFIMWWAVYSLKCMCNIPHVSNLVSNSHMAVNIGIQNILGEKLNFED